MSDMNTVPVDATAVDASPKPEPVPVGPPIRVESPLIKAMLAETASLKERAARMRENAAKLEEQANMLESCVKVVTSDSSLSDALEQIVALAKKVKT